MCPNRFPTPLSAPAADLGGDGISEAIDLSEIKNPTHDLSDVSVSELGDIIINRTKTQVSPFVPIVKTPNYSENSGNLTGYSVEIEDKEEKTGYRHIGNVSANYLLLRNEDVRALSMEIAMKSGLEFRESRIFWDGARFLHVIDFLESEHLSDDEEIGLGLITQSSYDRSWRYRIALMGKRFVCDNGMISGEFFAEVNFKHMKSVEDEDETWQEIVKRGLSIIDQAPNQLHRFVEALRYLCSIEMTESRMRQVWQSFPTIGDSLMGQIMTRYVQHEEPTLFGFLNAGTNVFWHNEKLKASDMRHNESFVSGLLAEREW